MKKFDFNRKRKNGKVTAVRRKTFAASAGAKATGKRLQTSLTSNKNCNSQASATMRRAYLLGPDGENSEEELREGSD